MVYLFIYPVKKDLNISGLIYSIPGWYIRFFLKEAATFGIQVRFFNERLRTLGGFLKYF